MSSHSQTITIVVRPAAEMTIKGRQTRVALRRRLKGNVTDALRRAELKVRVQARFSRLIATVEAEPGAADEARERARDALGRVFGVGSFSFALGHAAPRLDEIVRVGASLFEQRVRGRRYAVRCKRVGTHPFRSMDVERRLGAALNEGATVDLTDPEVTVAVEVDQAGATFFSEKIPGAGGLPLGAGGRALALLSGGYDSAVAAWMLMKRGIAVDFVLFRMGGDVAERLALQVAKVLSDRWAAGTRPTFHSVDFEAITDELRGSSQPGYWQLVLKRQMLRAADRVADEVEREQAAREESARAQGRGRSGRRGRPAEIGALITGESVGQVSSQTLSNLRSIDAAAERPVLRPLVGLDKREIIDLADKIGTAALSARVREYCAITPGHPATSSSVARVDREETALRPAVVEEAVAQRKSLAMRALEPADLVLPFLFIEDVPDDAVLVDCRPDAARASWRPEGTMVRAVPELIEQRGSLDKERTYVLFCQFGTQSAQAAEVLQQLGFEAYSFRGGVPSLQRHLRRSAGEQRETAAPVGE